MMGSFHSSRYIDNEKKTKMGKLQFQTNIFLFMSDQRGNTSITQFLLFLMFYLTLVHLCFLILILIY